MDSSIKALSKSSHIAVTYVDVTESVQALERRHLSGPAAAVVLGEALAAVAIMGSNIAGKDEKISMQMQVDGKVEGGIVEASATGELRGYTNIKVINELDGESNIDIAQVLGENGDFCIQQSNESVVISNSIYSLKPASIRAALARYYNETLQRPTAAEVYALIENGYLKKAVAVIAEKMPDGDSESFLPVLESFDNKEVYSFLTEDYSFERLKKVLKLPDLEVTSEDEFKFSCECSRERVLGMLGSLDKVDLQEIADIGDGQAVTCHFCGADYRITDAEIKGMF